MSLIDRIFAGASRPSHDSSRLQSTSLTSVTSPSATRRELLRVVLRDTLVKHGIPSSWVQPEMLISTGGGREPGIHMRLLIKHWDPRLLVHSVAFEKSFNRRVELFDPLAPNWLRGVSWQFALLDPSACPDMPDPATWTAPPDAAALTPASRRAQLDRVMAAGDAKTGANGFARTQPIRSDRLQDARQPLLRPRYETSQPLFRPTEPASL